MPKTFHFSSFFITWLSAILLNMGCIRGGQTDVQSKTIQKLSKDQENEENDVSLSIIPIDNNGTKATFAATSDKTQVLGGMPGTSTAGSSLAITPGSLAQDVEISIKEASPLTDTVSLKEIGLPEEGAVSASGTPILVDASSDADIANPMTLSLPIPAVVSLAGARKDFVILYRVKTKSKKVKTGLIPTHKIDFLRDKLKIKITLFGAYQVALLTNPALAEKEIEKDATQPIQAADGQKVEGQDLPDPEKEIIANAGEDQTVQENVTVQLDASASTVIDGVSYKWSQTAGPTVSLEAPDSERPTFIAPNVASETKLIFSLEIKTQSGKQTQQDEVAISVQGINEPPTVAELSDQSVDEGQEFSISAIASDPEESSLTYLWTQTSGTTIPISDNASADLILQTPNILTQETFVFEVKVSDGELDSEVKSFTLTVNGDNDAPAANAGPNQNVAENSTVQLDGSNSSDPENQFLAFTWSQTSGTSVTLSDSGVANPTFTSPNLAADENLTFNLTVSDGSQTSNGTVVISVTASNTIPVADAGSDITTSELQTVTLNGTASSDAEGSALTYLWSQTSGTAVSLDSNTIASPSFTVPDLSASETLVFSLIVNDGTNSSPADTVNVNAFVAPEIDFFGPSNLITSMGVNSNVTYTMNFSENVFGLDISDFTLNQYWGSTGATITNIAGGPKSYTVTVQSGNSYGSLALNFADNSSVIGASGLRVEAGSSADASKYGTPIHVREYQTNYIEGGHNKSYYHKLIDFDGDGDLDILLGSYEKNSVEWYENTGSFPLKRHIISNITDRPSFVDAVDIDGDGDMDVLATSYVEDSLSLFKNDGSNTNFSKETIATGLNGPKRAKWVDLDGDGDQDIVATLEIGDALIWLQNDGQQNFSTNIIDSTLDGANGVDFGDFNEDGNQDIVVVSYIDDQVNVYLGDGSGGFSLNSISSIADGPYQVKTVDLDQDSNLDFVLTAYLSDSIIAYLGDGAGVFTEVVIDNTINGPKGFDFGDLDGDGDIDFATHSELDNEISWITNQGSNTFIRTVLKTNVYGNSHHTSIGDLDGDGDKDIMTNVWSWGMILMHENQGSSTFTDKRILGQYRLIYDIATGDLNGDSKLDIVTSSTGNGGNITLSTNDGLGNFSTQVLATDSVAKTFTNLKLADADGDGDQDIFALSFTDDKIVLIKNNGSSPFTTQTVGSAVDSGYGLDAGDIDNDGDMDFIVTSNLFSNGPYWFENQGSLSFTKHTITTSQTSMRDIKLSDLDGDGDLDFILISTGDTSLFWYENDGSQNFTANEIYNAFNYAYFVEIVDLDKDGDKDIIVPDYSDAKIYYFENDGAQAFTANIVATSMATVHEILITDLNGDTEWDILATDRQNNKILKLINNGSEIFTKTTLFENLGGPSHFAEGDFDGDGVPDYAVGTFYSNDLLWLKKH